MNYFIYFLATIIPLGLLDALWLFVLAKNFYAKEMEFLFSGSVNIIPAAFFYPIYALAILLLVVMPTIPSGTWTEVLWRGALLGLAAYGTYDLTNHATIAGWPTVVTIVDIGWGIVVTAVTSVIAHFFITSFK